MPIFEYKCKNCSKKFETIISQKTVHTVECPYCGSAENEKLVSGFAQGSSTKADCGSNCGPSKGFS